MAVVSNKILKYVIQTQVDWVLLFQEIVWWQAAVEMQL
jgi:hypothetical protein